MAMKSLDESLGDKRNKNETPEIKKKKRKEIFECRDEMKCSSMAFINMVFSFHLFKMVVVALAVVVMPT